MKLFTLEPLINEKSYNLSKGGVYIFKTNLEMNINELKKEIEKTFEVKITKINSSIIKGKAKRTTSLNGRRQSTKNGSRSNYKKAYVTLEKGNKLPFFENIEEEAKKEEKTQKQFDKAISKNIQKDQKKNLKSVDTKRRFSLRKRPEGK